MFSDFPNLHPLVVHVPIVLILLGAATQALLVFKDWQQVRWGTLLILAGGFAGALAASTVFHAEATGLGARAAAVFAAHEKYASYTLWLSGITLLLRGIGQFFHVQRRAYEVLVLAFALAAAGTLSVAGHRGAQLVYVEGVGPQGHLVSKHHGHDDEEQMPGMTEQVSHHEESSGTGSPSTGSPPTASSQQPPTSKPAHPADMPGMDMGAPASARPQHAPATGQMGDMRMPETKATHRTKPAGHPTDMATMPGMHMPAASRTQPMPKGMVMQPTNSPKQQHKMAGMAEMPGMSRQPTKPQPPAAAAGMADMATMPGMKPAQPAQPAPAMEAAPGTHDMPGMTIPNPLDKFRFKDNNPARTQSSPKK
ncbi:DUF2231 domain-containing protein [Hymenobacter weizhouensis]|uniref:DUF2231 domain-containing protein n=1 Tax=Hymenobacter sp. YIM 151500-1 TaxID=2987689 RepID=UPI002227D791|nr:DUF2231 domain-containing protein [Hymenobacter sp. YIM 151500-1]UYZ65273.1 hypothetical protein OIS53_19995 [Hymenobacter sp. YIM 151500-1]